jgi:hypothetical protein
MENCMSTDKIANEFTSIFALTQCVVLAEGYVLLYIAFT